MTELDQHLIQRCKKLIEKKRRICPVSSFWSSNDLNKHGFRIKTVYDHLIAGSNECLPVLYVRKTLTLIFLPESFNEEFSHDNYINFKKRFLEMESIVILNVRISGFLSFVHTLSHYGLLIVICVMSGFGKLTENVLFEQNKSALSKHNEQSSLTTT